MTAIWVRYVQPDGSPEAGTVTFAPCAAAGGVAVDGQDIIVSADTLQVPDEGVEVDVRSSGEHWWYVVSGVAGDRQFRQEIQVPAEGRFTLDELIGAAASLTPAVTP